MKPLNEFRCINPNCSEYEKRGGINPIVHQIYGSDPIRLLECKECGIIFSEIAHATLSRCDLSKDVIISILHHLVEGYGQRQTCRLLGVRRDTMRRLTRIVGIHAKSLHDELVNGVQVSETQTDEKGSFVGEKRGSLAEGKEAHEL
jgi:transposase-like protein